MNVQKKIFLSTFAVVAALVIVSAGVGVYATRETQRMPVSAQPSAPQPASDQPLTSKPFHLSEGYTVSLVDGWELISHTPDRQVDRYRFERKNDPAAIFTISVYDQSTIESFQDLITTRYGSSALSSEQDVKLANLQAKKVTAEFLNMGLTADMLVQVDPQVYISLYGVQPGGEDANVQREIDFMQNSFAA